MISLAVKESARAITFYAETLGLQMIGKPGEVTLFRAGEVTIVLNHPAGAAAKSALAGAVEVIFRLRALPQRTRYLLGGGAASSPRRMRSLRACGRQPSPIQMGIC
jgi:hypothetical protein